jgi:hypothetical protein
MSTGSSPARSHGWAHLLVILVVTLLLGVADATPPESLHIPGLHDGGDYDSVIQPRILTLIGIPDRPVFLASLRDDSPDRVDPFRIGSPPEPFPASAQSRAPPAR